VTIVKVPFVRSKRAVVLVGVCALAAIGVAVGFLVAGGSSGPAALPTTGQFAPITVPKSRIPLVGGVLLGDPEVGGIGSDLGLTLNRAPGRNHYRITVSNTSSIGVVNSLQWFPPPGVKILAVTGSTAGRCGLSGTTGLGGNLFKNVVLYPNIRCDDVNLKPMFG